MEMSELIKKELLNTIDIINSIKMWIQLSIPKVGGKDEQNVFVQVFYSIIKIYLIEKFSY